MNLNRSTFCEWCILCAIEMYMLCAIIKEANIGITYNIEKISEISKIRSHYVRNSVFLLFASLTYIYRNHTNKISYSSCSNPCTGTFALCIHMEIPHKHNHRANFHNWETCVFQIYFRQIFLIGNVVIDQLIYFGTFLSDVYVRVQGSLVKRKEEWHISNSKLLLPESVENEMSYVSCSVL